MWKFVCADGTEFVSKVPHLLDAVEDFFHNTGKHLQDVKNIVNLRHE